MNILIAPNAFKNSISARSAAEAIQDGFKQSSPHYNCECFPVGDGGDGTAKLIVEKCLGFYSEAVVHDPLGRKINTTFGLIDGGNTAVIEMADASGIRLLAADELSPLHTTSSGTGELIKLALDKEVVKIILCMGGSATVDGGSGILNALGIRFLDNQGFELTDLPGNLVNLSTIDRSGLDLRLANCEIVVLCDVGNYLLGPQGAAAVFGPQKGADAAAVKKLEAALLQFNRVALKITGKDMASIPHGGTAGGAAAGLDAFLSAQLVNGADYFLKLTDFKKALQGKQLVVTGEGSLDEQTLQGKAPYAVAFYAKAAGVPVIGLAGRIPMSATKHMEEYFDILLAIGNEPTELSEAIQHTEANLTRTANALGNLLTIGKTTM